MFTIRKIASFAVGAAAAATLGAVLTAGPAQLSAVIQSDSGDSGVLQLADSPWDTPPPGPTPLQGADDSPWDNPPPA